MANINGTNLAAPIVPFTDADVYPTHYAQYGHGGLRTVGTNANRDAIPMELRENGMLVFVDDNGKYYKWINGSTWEELTTGGASSGGVSIIQLFPSLIESGTINNII